MADVEKRAYKSTSQGKPTKDEEAARSEAGIEPRKGVMVHMDVKLRRRLDTYRARIDWTRSAVIEDVLDRWLKERGY